MKAQTMVRSSQRHRCLLRDARQGVGIARVLRRPGRDAGGADRPALAALDPGLAGVRRLCIRCRMYQTPAPNTAK